MLCVASGALRRRVMVLAPGQPIPHGRPYRYHLNGLIHMMTARKRVGPLLTHHLAVSHSVDYSSLDHFSLDDSSRDSSSSSSSETSSDSYADALSDSVSSRSSSDHSLPTPSSGMRSSHHLCSLVPSIHRLSAAISNRPSHDYSSASPSRKRSRSPTVSVPLSSPTLGALSYARADLLPSPKRIRSPKTATDLEGCSEVSFEPYVPREAGLGVDFEDESSEPSSSRGTDLEEDLEVVRSDGIDIDPEIQAEIDESLLTKVVVDDIPEPAQEGAVEVTYETLEIWSKVVHDPYKEISGSSCSGQYLTPDLEHQGHIGVDRKKGMEEMEMEGMEMERMEMEEIEMVVGTEEEMAITLEDLCLLESAHIKTS
ncbi:hypothetical protein Tco_0730935 [Tanacetum coccineum]